MYHSSPTRRPSSHMIASFSPRPMMESVTKMINSRVLESPSRCANT